jgi:hypothetical protein
MKRTEKIEIRLSHEEKTSLTGLAEKEGRSVSRLVRDVVSKYMELNTARIPSKLKRSQFGGMLALAGILGFGVSSALSLVGKSEIYLLSGHMYGAGFNTPLHRKAQKPHIINVRTKEGVYQIQASFSHGPDLSRLKLIICKKTHDSCEEIAADSLLLHPDTLSSLDANAEGQFWSFTLEGPNYGNKAKRAARKG